jgi:hypothetical protein
MMKNGSIYFTPWFREKEYTDSTRLKIFRT